MFKKYKSTKGITLVALVITIIILLILAGITISQLTGSGLFEKAQLAQQKSKETEEKEQLTLSDYENKIGQYIDASRNDINSNLFDYKNKGEKIIGTWYDGKLLYEVSIPVTGPTVTTGEIYVTEEIDISQYNPDACVIFYGYLANEKYSFTMPYFETTGGTQFKVSYAPNAQKIQVTSNEVQYSGMTGYVTLHYTKKD